MANYIDGIKYQLLFGEEMTLQPLDLSIGGGYDASGGIYPPGAVLGSYYWITTGGVLPDFTVISGDWILYDGVDWFKGDAIVAGVGTVTTETGTQSGSVIISADSFDDTLTTNKFTTQAEIDKLTGIQALAEVNNISDVSATDLTDAGDSALHYHATDRDRTNHTGTQDISTVTGITFVSNAEIDAWFAL